MQDLKLFFLPALMVRSRTIVNGSSRSMNKKLQFETTKLRPEKNIFRVDKNFVTKSLVEIKNKKHLKI